MGNFPPYKSIVFSSDLHIFQKGFSTENLKTDLKAVQEMKEG